MLKALTPTHLRSLYRERLDAGLSPRTVCYVHTTLNRALSQAVSDGLFSRNVAASMKGPKHRQAEIRPLDSEQVRALQSRLRTPSRSPLHRSHHRWAPARRATGASLGGRGPSGMLQVRRTLSEPAQGESSGLLRAARAGRYGSPVRPQKPSESTAGHS
jgi:integrase